MDLPPEPGDLQPGDLVADRYRVEAAIGRGGMGAVYRAYDLKLEVEVALKLLTRAESRDARERFLREIVLARKVTHPSVARTFDLGEFGEQTFLTMELIEGENLEDLLWRRIRLPESEALPIARAIAEGLAAAHRVGVIHRDLKPANVLLATDGRVLLSDFGIARGAKSDRRTHADGTTVGTPEYMSPEQVLDGDVGPASDVFALGVILFEALSGRHPFDGTGEVGIALARVSGTAPPLSDCAPPGVTWSEELVALVARCLARQPKDRPPSGAVGQRLAHLANDDAGYATASLALPPMPERSVVVLPFTYRGPDEHAFLGDALAEELTDALARGRGLRVRAFNPNASLDEVEGAEWACVTGTVVLRDGGVRTTARLVAPDGEQAWTGKFDAALDDLLSLEETLARRICEALEVEAAIAPRSELPAAHTNYLRARRLMRMETADVDTAVELLDGAMDDSPGAAVIVAGRALAAVRAALWSDAADAPGPRLARAAAALEDAKRAATDEVHTHLAEALLARHELNVSRELTALIRAIEIAPTCAEAHQLLAETELAIGYTRRARRRLELALELNPALIEARLSLARIAAFEGDDEGAYALIDEGRLSSPTLLPSVAVALYRADLWFGRRDRIKWLCETLTDAPAHALVALLCRYALGEAGIEALVAFHRELSEWLGSNLIRLGVAVTLAEACAARGEVEFALGTLAPEAHALYDADWLVRCPTLASIRGRPAYKEIREQCRANTARALAVLNAAAASEAMR